MLDRDEVNQWLERAASGGVADRSQMIDRVVDGSRGDARAQLAVEAARDRAELLPGARQSAGRSPIEVVVLEVQTFAKWNGIDQDPVIAGQLDHLRSTLTDVAAAPAVDDHDMREVRFGFSDQMLRGGNTGVLGTARAQDERAAGVLAPAANAAASSELDAVRNVLRAQHGATRGAGSGAERRYEPPAAGPSAGLER